MKVRPQVAGAALTALALAACGRGGESRSGGDGRAAETRPDYTAVVLAAHGVDHRACFGEVRLEDVAPPAAPSGEAVVPKSALVAVDSSGSMAASMGGTTKMAAAQGAVRTFVSALPADTPVGLAAFGHRGTNTAAGKSASCGAGAEVLAASARDRAGLLQALGALKPAGWTPLAAAIRQGAAGFPAEGEGPRVLYVVSDGIETCEGDPVAAARVAAAGPTKVIVNVIGFDVTSAAEQAQLRTVAEAGGGQFLHARSAEELQEALRRMAQGRVRDFYVDTAFTRARNVIEVGGAVSRASQCVRRSVEAERQAAVPRIMADEKAGRVTTEEAAAARGAIADRGSLALDGLVAYSEALQEQEQGRAQTLWTRFTHFERRLVPGGGAPRPGA